MPRVQEVEAVKTTPVLDATTIDTGIELGKKVAERHGLGAWITTAVVGILFVIQLLLGNGNTDPNLELINERLTQELVKPYTERIAVLETTVNSLQLNVVELQSQNTALVSTNAAYSATIVSLQQQLEAIQEE